MFSPSGDHARYSAEPATEGAALASPRRPVSSRYNCDLPLSLRSERKARRDPSGDQRAPPSLLGPPVTSSICLVSTSTTHTRVDGEPSSFSHLEPVNAILRASGDAARSEAPVIA